MSATVLGAGDRAIKEDRERPRCLLQSLDPNESYTENWQVSKQIQLLIFKAVHCGCLPGHGRHFPFKRKSYFFSALQE